MTNYTVVVGWQIIIELSLNVIIKVVDFLVSGSEWFHYLTSTLWSMHFVLDCLICMYVCMYVCMYIYMILSQLADKLDLWHQVSSFRVQWTASLISHMRKTVTTIEHVIEHVRAFSKVCIDITWSVFLSQIFTADGLNNITWCHAVVAICIVVTIAQRVLHANAVRYI